MFAKRSWEKLPYETKHAVLMTHLKFFFSIIESQGIEPIRQHTSIEGSVIRYEERPNSNANYYKDLEQPESGKLNNRKYEQCWVHFVYLFFLLYILRTLSPRDIITTFYETTLTYTSTGTWKIVATKHGKQSRFNIYLVDHKNIARKMPLILTSLLPEFSENPPWAAIRKMGVS